MVRSKNVILFNIGMKYMKLEYRKWYDRSTALSLGNMRSLNCFVLSDCMLWLGKRWSVELSGSRGCFRSKNALFEEAMSDELF